MQHNILISLQSLGVGRGKGGKWGRSKNKLNVKEFLYSVRNEQKEIDELNARIYELEMSLLPSGIRYDKDKVQTSPSDTVTDREIALADYMTLLEGHKDELAKHRTQAEKMIQKIDDPFARTILSMRFLSIKKYSMYDIGKVIGLSEPQTWRIYRNALRKLNMIVNDSLQF